MTSNQRKIIIIGCGMSGIAAAVRLKQAGHSPLILEATDHVGGRTHTVLLGDGTPVDLGGSWIQGSRSEPKDSPRRNPLFNYLPDDARLFEGEDTNLFFPDSLERVPEEVASRCFKVAGQITQRTIEHARSSPDHDVDTWTYMNRELAKIVDDSFSPQEIKMIRTMLISRAMSKCCDPDEMTILQMGVDGAFGKANDSLLVRGYRTIVSRMLADNDLVVGRDILLSTPVDLIDTSKPGQVTIHTRNPELAVVTATLVLCTIPLGALKFKEAYKRLFNPPLPPPKIHAIETMGIGLLAKTFLRFDRVFWDPKVTYYQSYISRELFDPSPRSIVSKPLHFGFFIVALGNLQTPPRPVLCCFANASYAWFLEKQSDEACKEIVMSQLRGIFKDVDVPEPVEMLRTKWGQSEFAGGAYSHVKINSGNSWPEIVETLYKPLREPLKDVESGKPRVFFAGEHTHEVCFSWVHGGFLSGDREGERMVEELAKE